MDWNAIFLSLRLALVVCTTELIVGTPIAVWLSFTRWRWKFFAESIVAMPLVLPPTVLGFYVLVALGSNSPIGHLSEALIGHSLPFIFHGLVATSINTLSLLDAHPTRIASDHRPHHRGR